MDSKQNSNNIKLLGKLGFDLSRLKSDVNETKRLIEAISNETATLGDSFSKATQKVENNIKAQKRALKSYKDDLLKTAKHDYAIGKIDVKEYVKQLNEVIKASEPYTKKRMEAEKELAGVRKQFQKEYESSIRKSYQVKVKLEKEALNEELKNIKIKERELKKSLKEQEKFIINQSKDTFNKLRSDHLAGKITPQGYIDALTEAKESGVLLENEIRRADIEINRVANRVIALNERVAKETSRNLLKAGKDAFDAGKINITQYRNYLERILNLDKLNTDERKKAKVALYRLNQSILKDQEKDVMRLYNLEKQIERERSKLHPVQSGAVGVYNYGFGASMAYSAIRGIREISGAVKDIEGNVTNLKRVAKDLNETEIRNITESAFKIGDFVGKNVNDIQKIQNLWARTSSEIANSKEALDYLTRITAVGLNIGGFESAEEAVKLLNSTLRQMGLEWNQAEDVMNSWAKTADTTAVGSAKDLADMTMRVGSQAKLLGLNYQELNAITAVMANNMARSGEEIGTALKTVFAYLQDDQAIKVLEKYGVEVRKNAKEFNSFIYIMERLQEVYRQLDIDKNQQAIHEINKALGRTRRVDYVGTLISNWSEMKEIYEEISDSTGYAMEQNELVMESLEAKLGQLQVAFQRLAWSIGESGLLDDLKALVMGITDTVEWFNSLDTGTMAFILRLTELGVALGLINKSIQLLLGTGFTSAVKNQIAQIAVLTGNQNLLNIAISSGAKVKGIDIATTTASTGAINANTKAKQADIVVTKAQALAQVNVNNAKVAGATITSSLTGAISGLLNPINLAIAGVIAFTAYLHANRKAMEENERTMKAIADAKENLDKILSKPIVSEVELPNVEKRLSELEELSDRYDELKSKKEELDKSFSEQNSIGVGHSSEAFKLARELGSISKELREVEEQIKLEGSSVERLKDDISKLNTVISASSIEENRKAQALLDVIEKKQRFNDKTRDLISQYIALREEFERTGAVTKEFTNVTNELATTFPQYANEVDNVTKLRVVDTDAILKQIKVKGSLTEAQKREITETQRLSEATKQSALARIQAEIETTKALKEQALDQIEIYKQLQQSMPRPVESYSATGMVRDFVRNIRPGFDPMLGNLDEFNSDIERLEQAKEVIKNLGKFDPSLYDTPISESSKSKKKKEEYKPEVDRYFRLNNIINDLNSKLEYYNRLSEVSDESQNILYLQKQIDLYKQKQQVLHDLNNEQRKEREELKQSLSSRFGFKFMGDEITNYKEKLGSMIGDTAKEAENAVKRYAELSHSVIPKTSNDWWELESSIRSAREEINKITEDLVDMKISNLKSVEDKLVDIIRKQIENELEAHKEKNNELGKIEEERHQKNLQRLEDEFKAYEKIINEKLKQIDEEENQRDYENRLGELERERFELLERYNELALDDSVEGRYKANEIYKELTRKEKDIEELKHRHNVNLRKKNLQDQLDSYKEDYEHKVNSEKDKYEFTKRQLELELKDTEEFYNKKLQKDSLYREAHKLMVTHTFEELSEMFVEFENEFGDGMSLIGDSIKKNLIDNLREAIELMNKLEFTGVETNIKEQVSSGVKYKPYLSDINKIVWYKGVWDRGDERDKEWASKEARKHYDKLPNDIASLLEQMNYRDAFEWYKSIAKLDTGGMLNFRGSDAKLILAHKNEVVHNPIQTKELLMSSLAIKSAMPNLKSLLSSNSKTKQYGLVHFDKLIEVHGDVASDKLDNVKEFTSEVLNELKTELIKIGVI